MIRQRCAECSGGGKLVGIGCLGFERLEVPCLTCQGSGIAPEWQRDAIEAGLLVKAYLQAKGYDVLGACLLYQIRIHIYTRIISGRLPVAHWPKPIRELFHILQDKP